MNTRGEVIAALRDALNTERTLLSDTYRHLDRPATLMGMTIVQWAICFTTVLSWWGLMKLMPFGTQTSMSLSGTIVGIPATLLFFVISEGEFNLAVIARSVIRWRRGRGVLLPGAPEQLATGYEILDESSCDDKSALPAQYSLTSAELWD
jgi:hypothetical protein